MKYIGIISRVLLGLIFVVFGLSGFLIMFHCSISNELLTAERLFKFDRSRIWGLDRVSHRAIGPIAAPNMDL
jgi:hypothetical protein